ncbi:MAG: tail fiber protein [Bacteroidota bacterium]
MDPFLGEIVMFGGNFAPRGWAFCNGQLLPINQYQALFSILGTTYGGDGRTTFALPELRGRAAMHAGNGPGLTPRPLGQKSGQESVTLNSLQMPSHSHTAIKSGNVRVQPSANLGDTNFSAGNALGATARDIQTSAGIEMYATANNLAGDLGGVSDDINFTITNTGGNYSHNNMQPYQVINYIIALQGVFPSRS